MKMIRTSAWLATRWRCNSSPPIPGMRTSRIRQSVSRARSELRNSSAEANTSTMNLTDLSKARSDSRTASSSSTTEMRGIFAIWKLSPSMIGVQRRRSITPWYRGNRAWVLWFFVAPHPQLLGHPDQVCQRPRAHLVHHLCPMDLHGDFAGVDLGGDLFVEQLRDHLFHHFPLTPRQRRVGGRPWRHLSPIAGQRPRAIAPSGEDEPSPPYSSQVPQASSLSAPGGWARRRLPSA